MRWGTIALLLAATPLQALAQSTAEPGAPTKVGATAKSSQDFSWMFAEGKPTRLSTVISGSMTPALQTGDQIAGFTLERAPKRGDILSFRHPKFTDGIPYVKRVIGLPGDTVQMQGGRLYLNGVMIERTLVREVTYVERGWRRAFTATEYSEQLPGEDAPHLIHEFSDTSDGDDTRLFTVPEGHVFMMGDNRDFSEDSRALSGYAPFVSRREPNAHYTSATLPDKDSKPAIGFVPIEMIIARVRTVLQSVRPCEKAFAEELGAVCLPPSVNKRL